MAKKDISPAAKLPEDDNWQDKPDTDERFEAAVGQLLDSEADPDEEAWQHRRPLSPNDADATGRRSKQEIEALLERMIFAEKAFLEYPN